MRDYTPKIEEQVSWNLSQEISGQIASLIRTGRRYAISGDVLNSFFMFKEIRLLINHHLNSKEIEKVEDLEDAINRVNIEMRQLSIFEEDDFEFDDDGSRQRGIKLKLIVLKNKRLELNEKYRRKILDLLDSYGYLMERKKDSAHMF